MRWAGRTLTGMLSWSGCQDPGIPHEVSHRPPNPFFYADSRLKTDGLQLGYVEMYEWAVTKPTSRATCITIDNVAQTQFFTNDLGQVFDVHVLDMAEVNDVF